MYYFELDQNLTKEANLIKNTIHEFARDLMRPIAKQLDEMTPQEVIAEDVPIAAVVREGQREKYRDLLGGVEIWEHEPSASELDGFAAEVEAADWSREA